MKKLFAFLFVFMFCMTAFGLNINVSRQDMKLATQAMIEHQTITTPIVALTTRLKSAQATSASVTTTVSTFLAQPDVPRNITITTGGTTADVNAGDVVVTGTNFFGKAITESIAITENQAGTSSGVKAFKTVTSVVIPIQDGTGALYDIGVGDVLGLKRCMANVGAVAWAVFDGAFEATRPTCVADVDEVEKNTCDINGTLNGAKNVELYFVQNFRCGP